MHASKLLSALGLRIIIIFLHCLGLQHFISCSVREQLIKVGYRLRHSPIGLYGLRLYSRAYILYEA